MTASARRGGAEPKRHIGAWRDRDDPRTRV